MPENWIFLHFIFEYLVGTNSLTVSWLIKTEIGTGNINREIKLINSFIKYSL